MSDVKLIDDTIREIGNRFRCFGGGRDSETNPVAHALRNEPLAFAANVDVRAVVEFVASRFDGLEKENARLRHLAHQLEGYVMHKPECELGADANFKDGEARRLSYFSEDGPWYSAKCTCGLAALTEPQP